LGGPAQISLWFQAGGPAQYPEACKLSRNLFVDNLNILLVGYSGTCYSSSITRLLGSGAKLKPA